MDVKNPSQRLPKRLIAIEDHIGLVGGFRCSACSWSISFDDTHTPWAIPACYLSAVFDKFMIHKCTRRYHKALTLTGCPLPGAGETQKSQSH